ncbi:unnamed protein product [Paramecium sonneborni]|uniref:Uncharacterized protein n=1 Tax=Paramecium sonneborni TaxID=65129 RepID=A0A8S1K4U6_9CILI|nr:unnamed protein product [Paramecium sonneborni]
MKQLSSMASNEQFDARNQATRFYIKQKGIKIQNTVSIDALSAIIAV